MALGQTVHRNTVDASVTSGKPSTNYADAKQLHLQTSAAYAFLHFNRPFPLGATIVDAWLRVYTKGSWGITPTLTVRRPTAGWRANRLTWNNQPAVGGIDAQATHSSAIDGDEWAFDVKAALQAVSDGADWHGFRIGTDAALARYLYSGNSSADLQPVLEVTWSQAPQAPSTLTPSGGRAVSIAKPVLSCDFTDHAGSTQMSGMQVQVDPAGNWTTPAFDYTDPDAVVPEIDLGHSDIARFYPHQKTRSHIRARTGEAFNKTYGIIHPGEQWESDRGLRLPRTGLVMEALIPSVLEQKVTTHEAYRAWRLLVRRYGEPAPGPHENLYVMPEPRAWCRIPSWEWHRAGVDNKRSATVIRAAQRAPRLEEAASMDLAEAMRRLQLIPGVGPWTAAETIQRSNGDPDALTVGDLHLPSIIGYSLTGARDIDDAGMLELLAPYEGQRHRAARLILLEGQAQPRRQPRFPIGNIARL